MLDIECLVCLCFFFIGDIPFALGGATRSFPPNLVLEMETSFGSSFKFGGLGGICDALPDADGAGGFDPAVEIFASVGTLTLTSLARMWAR